MGIYDGYRILRENTYALDYGLDLKHTCWSVNQPCCDPRGAFSSTPEFSRISI